MRFNNRTSYAIDPIFGVALLIALIVGAGIVFGVVNATHTESFTKCLVTDKDRTTSTDSDGNTTSDARVYTENCGTFQVADSVLSWTFSSADTFGSIREDRTYDFTTRGYRIPFMSTFPNIVKVKEVSNVK